MGSLAIYDLAIPHFDGTPSCLLWPHLTEQTWSCAPRLDILWGTHTLEWGYYVMRYMNINDILSVNIYFTVQVQIANRMPDPPWLARGMIDVSVLQACLPNCSILIES